MKLMHRPNLLVNFVEALCAIILGNIAYFILVPAVRLPRHRPFQMDWGLVVDFWLCVVAYGLIRTARRWR
jgi:hypothetical protein